MFDTILDLLPLHLHFHFIQFQVNPRCCHVILWCLYFFFLSRNFDWLSASYLLMNRKQFSFWFLVSNKSETRPIRRALKLQLRHREALQTKHKFLFSIFKQTSCAHIQNKQTQVIVILNPSMSKSFPSFFQLF